MPLTLDQAVMISQRIWRNAPSLPDRATRLRNLRRACQLVELAKGRERIARRNSVTIYNRVAVYSKAMASSLEDMEVVLQMWRSQQADPDYLIKLDLALALLDESGSMPDFLAKLKERL